jgi:V/A-type H+-transporting ATPase subunit K
MPRIKFALALTLVAAVLSLGATVPVVWAGPAAPRHAVAAAVPARRPAGASLARRGSRRASSLGGLAVAKLGAAAVGALAEKPELFGRLLIFVGLAEGIAIYGVIISILILNRLG